MKTLSSPIDLIKKSFEIFFNKKNLLHFLKIYLILLPFEIFFIYQNYYTKNLSLIHSPIGLEQAVINMRGFIGVILVVNLVYIFINVWVSAAAIKAVDSVVAGQIMSVRDVYKFAWKKLWGFFLVGTLTFLAVFGGIIILIIPGIIFAIWFSFSKFIYINRKVGIKESLSESRRLVRGRFWGVFGRLIVFGLFVSLVGFIVSIVPYLGALVSALLGGLFILPPYLLYRELSEK